MSAARDKIRRLTEEHISSGEALFHDEYIEMYHWELSDADRQYADFYLDSRLNGCTEKLADMFAAQSPPMSNTDREFLEGHCCGSQFEKNQRMGDSLKYIAEKRGQMTKGKVYIGGLARFPGDPEAWVDGRGDVKRVVEKRGWTAEGSVTAGNTSQTRRPAKKTRKGDLAKRLHAAGLPMSE